MRRLYFPPALLLSTSVFLVACSKNSEERSTAEGPDPAVIPAEQPADQVAESEPVEFTLSGNKPAGSGDGTASGFSAGAAAGEPDVEPARWLMQPYPFYPLSQRIQGIEGRVDVRILINTEGRVDRAEVVGSTEPRYNDHALAAMRASRFVPQRENGKPVPLSGVFAVTFQSEFGSGTMPRNSALRNLAYHDGTYYMVGDGGKLSPAEIEKPVRFAYLAPLLPANVKEGQSLKATIKVTVSEEGQALNPSVSNASSPEFARALEEVLPFWQFIPRMKNGKPSRVSVEFPYVHNLAPPQKP